jgi:tRNA(adenine34) deaminase
MNDFNEFGAEADETFGDELLIDWDQIFMRRACELAEQAASEDEVPVGAVIVRANKIIGAGWNQREALMDPTAHAEMIAITQAAAAIESWRLEECTLYVTLEPCPMCAGAIVQSRIPRVVYGAADPKAGAVDSLFRLLDDPRLNHRARVTAGVMADTCGAMLSEFFRQKRQLGKK